MIAYLKRMFSWNGYAGRREFLGFYLLPLGMFSLGVVLPAFVLAWQDVPMGAGWIWWIILVSVCISLMLVCAWARRLRHLEWPIWIAFFPLVPFVNVLVYLGGLVLLLTRSDGKVREEKPTYLFVNLLVTGVGLLVPVGLLCSMLWLLQSKPDLFIKMLPKRQVQTVVQQPLAGPSVPVAREPLLPAADTSQGLSAQTPALARTKPLPMQLPAPKATVLADKIEWKQPALACDAMCQAVFEGSHLCLQYMSPDEQARLCVHLWNNPGQREQFYQVLVNPQGQISEYLVFDETKRPVRLGHFRNGNLKELLEYRSETAVYFFHLAKDGFEPDFTNPSHLPGAEFADVSMVLLSPQSWAPLDVDETGTLTQGNERTLTTPWAGLTASTRFLPQ